VWNHWNVSVNLTQCWECGADLASVCFSKFCPSCGWLRDAQEEAFRRGLALAKVCAVIAVLVLAMAWASGSGILAASLVGTFISLAECFRNGIGLRRLKKFPYVPPPAPLPPEESEELLITRYRPNRAPQPDIERLQTALRPRDVRLNLRGKLTVAGGILAPILVSAVLISLAGNSWHFVVLLVLFFPLSVTPFTLFWLRRQKGLIQMGDAARGTITDVGHSSICYRFAMPGQQLCQGFATLERSNFLQRGDSILIFFDPAKPTKQLVALLSPYTIS